MEILKTRTKDGIELEGILTGRKGSSETIIIHIPGMAGTITGSSYYPETYPKKGVHFLAVTHRGIGTAGEFNTSDGIRVIGSAYERFEDSVYDIEAWITKVSNLGYKNIWLQAHSLGPSKVAYYMNQTQDSRVTGLIWLSPADMIGLVHDPEGQRDHDKLMPEALELNKKGKSDQLLSHPLWGCTKISAGTYINLFADDANTGIFNYNELRDDWDVVNSIKVPVLAITGTKDDGIVPVKNAYEAMEQLEEELKSSPRVKTVVYEGAEHSFDGYSKEIVEEVLQFIGV